MSQGVWAQEFTEVPEKLQGEWTATDTKPSTGVLSEIDRRRVVVQLDVALNALRSLRAERRFWLGLGPGFRAWFEDFQGDLAGLLAAYRE